ncbi:unnamed protein product [Nippostrongylus brasiliensis]|uniref:Secreted protein n=1 Tax=Nippostrongylus brasiliensis TaxID=27835 RepID=A0A0N4YHS2_NIPBR|nr:unnamed protein product [Nippostrongylus brasiliensis]
MMYALAVLLLIAVNVQGQREECTLAPELVKVYQDFHNERFRPDGYVTVTFKPDMYEKAKEELNEPGKYSSEGSMYKVTRGSRVLPKNDNPIEKKVDRVLRSRLLRAVAQLKFHHPMKFGCAGNLTDVNERRQNLEITCLYTRDN